jgi:Secretion system C-terminal sorting domain
MNSWQKLPNTPAGNFYNLQICETNTNYLYASKDVGVFISTDGGHTWVDRSAGLPGNNITSLTCDPANPDYVVVTLSGLAPGTKVYASSNLGQTWTNISYNLPNIPVYSSVMQFGTIGSNFLYIGTSNGVFVKDKNSTTWELWGTNTPDVAVRDMEITYNNSMLRIGTFGKGMLQIPIKTTITEEIQQGMQGLAVTNIVNNAGTYNTTLSWMDYNEGEFSIELLRSTDGVNWTTRATLPANTISYTTAEFDPVTLCRKVYYKLLCIGNSISYSNVVEIDRDALLCKAPTALTVTVPSSDRFVLNWTDNNTNEAAYIIEVLKNNLVERQIEIPAFAGSGAVSYTMLNQVNYNNVSGYEYDPKQEYCFLVRAKAINATTGVASNQSCAILFPPPSNVSLSATSSTSITGSWVMPANATGNEVLLNTTYTLYSVGNAASPFVFSVLTPNTSYSISIRAAQSGYLGSNYLMSNSVSSNTVTTPDEVPTSLTASNVAGQFPVTLNWNYAISNSTSGEGFIIERSTNGVNYSLLVQANDITLRTYSDVSGIPGQLTYYYRIRAIHSGANVSAWSNTAIVTNTLPNAPTGLSVTQGLGKIANLVWTGNNTTASYEIYRSDNGGTSFTNIANSGTTTSYSDNTVPLYGTSYQYKVRAINNNGASAYSNTVSITLADNVPPASPTNLVVTAPQNSGIILNLSWTDNASDETGFRIERATTSTGPFSVIATTAANATTYSNTTGITQGVVYYYRVQAFKTVGANTYNSAYTTTANATAPGFLTPVNQVATPFSNTEIVINWQNLATAATGVEIHRSTTSTGAYTLVATVSPTAITYTNTGLTANTTYFYKLRAVINSPAQQTAFTTVVSAKTHTLFTNPPSGLTAVKLTSVSIKLDWVDNSTTENGFEVYQAINSSTGPFVLIATTAANIRTYTNTGLAAGNTYYYKVRGIKKTGSVVNSVTAFSNIASLNLTARLATNEVFAEQGNENKMSVSPNPANNKVQVIFTAETNGMVTLLLVNEKGNTVYTSNWQLQKGVNKTQISVKGFSPGVYIVSIKEGNVPYYKALVVQ